MPVKPPAVVNVLGWCLFAIAVAVAVALPRWLGPLRDARQAVTVSPAPRF